MDPRFSMWADVSSAAITGIKEKDSLSSGKNGFVKTTIEKLPDKVLLQIFTYLPHKEIGRLARVCKKWRMISSDSRLWTHVSLRPDISGLHVTNIETLLALIAVRFALTYKQASFQQQWNGKRRYVVQFNANQEEHFVGVIYLLYGTGPSLRYIELPIELITHTVLQELAYKCTSLTHMLLDFSTAMQLHDFSDLQTFPSRLRTMCICLSEVIFMEGFMRKIYNFINGLEVLHLIGTYEKVTEEEEEIYEVINIHKLKSAVPNLRVVNLYGIIFVDDSHVEALSSNCIQLECLAINYCIKFTGSTLKLLLQRCKKLKCLLMQQTSLKSEHVMAAEWDKTVLQELDITATELSTECLIDLLTRVPALRYLCAGQQDGFTDQVMKEWIEKGNVKQLVALDLDRNENISEEALVKLVKMQGPMLRGLGLSNIPHLTEHFWNAMLPTLRNSRLLIMGMPEDCCPKISQKIHVDSLMESIANNCPALERLEIRWDADTLRFSDRSSKAIDLVRVRCLRLRCMSLADGKYFELVKSNFSRADRGTVVRTTTNHKVTLCYQLLYYKDLLFN